MSMSPMSSAAAPASGPEVSGEGLPRVLVIDDSITILKVVRTILERNGYDVAVARDGAEGFEELRDHGPFSVVLLDFVMPRMNGYQFCRELRADAALRDLPVVLMSARTSIIGDRFVEQTGAVDALDKPFDARALIAVVGSVVAKRAADTRARSLPSPESMLAEDELSWQPSEPPPPSRHYRGMNRITALIAQTVCGPISRMKQNAYTQPQLVEDVIARSITPDILEDIAFAADDMEIESNEILRGELAKMPLAELLQLLQLRRQTGVMYVRHQRMSATMAIREGTLDFAQSAGTGDEFRIGRYFVEEGLLTREEIDAALAVQRDDQLLGEQLVEAGQITEDQLYISLAKQSSELVYESLRWPEGRFVLSEDEFSEEAALAHLGLGLSGLVLEGFRRVDEWRLMAGTIDFEAVLIVDQVALGTLDDGTIGKNERPVLMSIDGKRTAREVMEHSELASFDAIKALYRFLQSRIVREKLRAQPSHAKISVAETPEISVEEFSSPGDKFAPGSNPEKSDLDEPDLDEPDLGESDSGEPDLGEPDLGESDSAESDSAEPMVSKGTGTAGTGKVNETKPSAKSAAESDSKNGVSENA
jgi:CheY-like chemotaxis protein